LRFPIRWSRGIGRCNRPLRITLQSISIFSLVRRLRTELRKRVPSEGPYSNLLSALVSCRPRSYTAGSSHLRSSSVPNASCTFLQSLSRNEVVRKSRRLS
jgi:hypothetical protein